jgi:hypothetical protein
VAKSVVVSEEEEEGDEYGDGEKVCVCVCVWGRLGDGDGDGDGASSSSSFIFPRFGLVYHAMVVVFAIVALPVETKQVLPRSKRLCVGVEEKKRNLITKEKTTETRLPYKTCFLFPIYTSYPSH